MNHPNQDDLTLNSLFEEVSQEKPTNRFEDFCLLSNPFPMGEFYDFCVNQEPVKEEFTRILRTFYNDSQRQIMSILGSTGAGKTTLLRFLEQTLKQWREPNSEKKAITDLYTVFITQPRGSYLEIHQEIISQLSSMFFLEFFSRVRQRKINFSKLPDELLGTNTELIKTLAYIAQSHVQQSIFEYHPEQTLFLPEPQSYRILEKWLQGVKLTTAEKRELNNVSTDVGKSATVAIKFLSDLIKIFRHVELFKGIIIFFDEFEEVVSGRSSIGQAQYTQDLRNLFDSHSEGIVFIIATAPISEKLQKVSPALDRRLGPGVEITPISDETTALKYAKAYIEWGRNKFLTEIGEEDMTFPNDCQAEDQPYYPLTNVEIKEIYKKLKENLPSAQVLPGDLLPKLHHLLYQLVYEER